MFWWFDPIDNLEGLDRFSKVPRRYQTTFWQKVVDAYRYLVGGNSALLTIGTTEPGALLPIRFIFSHLFTARFGALDFPLFPLKILALGGLKLWDAGIDILYAARHYALWALLLYPAGIGLMLIGAIPILLHQLVSVTLTVILTMLSLPIIAAIHLITKLELKKMDNEFAKKYDAQNTSDVENVSLKEGGDEYRLSMKEMYVWLNDKSSTDLSASLTSVSAQRTKTIAENSVALHKKHPHNRLVLLHVSNFPTLRNQGQFPGLFYFYKFNYTIAGLAAFKELCQFNPKIRKDDYARNRDKNITRMLTVFSTLAQMTRNPEQRVFGRGAFIGYFNEEGYEVKLEENRWAITRVYSNLSNNRICREWHDKKEGIYAYYRDGFDQSVHPIAKFAFRSKFTFNEMCFDLDVGYRPNSGHKLLHPSGNIIVDKPVDLPLEMVEEIAVRAIDDDDLSLDDRHFILSEMRQACVSKQNGLFAAKSSVRVEEVADDDVEYDNAAYVRYTK